MGTILDVFQRSNWHATTNGKNNNNHNNDDNDDDDNDGGGGSGSGSGSGSGGGDNISRAVQALLELRSPYFMHEFCLQLTTRAVDGLRRFVVANGGSGGSDSKASATVLGRGSAPFAGSTGSGSTGSGSGPGSSPGRTGSSFGPMFGRHAVWESPFEQLERRVGDEASALLALLASANSSGLVSHTQLRVGWLRYAEEQQAAAGRQ